MLVCIAVNAIGVLGTVVRIFFENFLSPFSKRNQLHAGCENNELLNALKLNLILEVLIQ